MWRTGLVAVVAAAICVAAVGAEDGATVGVQGVQGVQVVRQEEAAEKGFMDSSRNFVEYVTPREVRVSIQLFSEGESPSESVTSSGKLFDRVAAVMRSIRSDFRTVLVQSREHNTEIYRGVYHFAQSAKGEFGLLLQILEYRSEQDSGESFSMEFSYAEPLPGCGDRMYFGIRAYIRSIVRGDYLAKNEFAGLLVEEDASFRIPQPRTGVDKFMFPRRPLGAGASFIRPVLGDRELCVDNNKATWGNFRLGLDIYGLPIGHLARSSHAADLRSVSKLLDSTGISFEPVQATYLTFANQLKYERETGLVPGTSFQLIVAVARNGRPAVILTISEYNPDRELSSIRKIVCNGGARGGATGTEVYLPSDAASKSNIGVAGTYAFICGKDGGFVQPKAKTLRVVESSEVGKRTAVKQEQVALDEVKWSGRWRQKRLAVLQTTVSEQKQLELRNRYKFGTMDYLDGYINANFRSRVNDKYAIQLKLGAYGRDDITALPLLVKSVATVGSKKALVKLGNAVKAATGRPFVVEGSALAVTANFTELSATGYGSYVVEFVFVNARNGDLALVARLPAGSDVQLAAVTQCAVARYSVTAGQPSGGAGGLHVALLPNREALVEGLSVLAAYSACNDLAAPCRGRCPAGYHCQGRGSDVYCVSCAMLFHEPSYSSCCSYVPSLQTCGRSYTLDERLDFCNKKSSQLSVSTGVEKRRKFSARSEGGNVCRDVEVFMEEGAACKLVKGDKGGTRCEFGRK
eukprot:CAMPEP_0198736902 /NCGR_PEP_ID=MMETSP1475-20131203/67594_1 /TAXON_ID= ORGANISM="Unidentified sp., Strain CCMP1999" /NCGR_SAMPLE_ID=MMETSP1475 /ASSEMBLY_ACC=CAM_ASM_001111 /LENGTH=746 /DNA_ID=CAMNT_0044500755 /DNA_START=13 /DNA_END=2253 /DNA_ORIENTATION=+